MLKLSAALTNIPVLSLRTGGEIGLAQEAIINPNNLKIEGWKVVDKFEQKELVLVANEVREIIDRGIIVNDHEVLVFAQDLVRLKPIMDIDFKILGKLVYTESGSRVGKVSDYAVETEALIIKKIYVSQSLLKNFSGGNVSIDRTQITEITDKRIIVEDPIEKSGAPAVAPAPQA